MDYWLLGVPSLQVVPALLGPRSPGRPGGPRPPPPPGGPLVVPVHLVVLVHLVGPVDLLDQVRLVGPVSNMPNGATGGMIGYTLFLFHRQKPKSRSCQARTFSFSGLWR